MERSIIHLNIADFAVGVERAMDRRLEKRPVIVAPAHSPRSAVYDMSEEAYQAGVQKGMPLNRAIRACKAACVIPPRPERYEQAMRVLIRHASAYSPLIEPGEGDGHVFLDMTGTRRLFGSPMDVAWKLRKTARNDLKLDPIWSVASNKLVAKAATRIVKPAGEYFVENGDEENFLSPLPIHLVPGIESGDLPIFRSLNMERVADVKALTLDQLEVPFGNRSRFIFDAVRGIDTSPVLPLDRKSRRTAIDYAFGNDANHAPFVEGALYGMVERLAVGLRRAGLGARRITLMLAYSDGIRIVRRRVWDQASAIDPVIFRRSREVLYAAWSRRIRIRRMRLILDRLCSPSVQLRLFPENEPGVESKARLTAAVDHIRNRFGRDVVRFARPAAEKGVFESHDPVIRKIPLFPHVGNRSH